LAEEIRVWLPGVLQFVKPYFTPDDIEKGTSWSSSISSELSSSNVGILCLTKDNIENPWILFEAGALSKNFDKSRVCTILFNLDTSDLVGPLTSFQATRFNKNDFKKLVETINETGSDSKLNNDVLNDVFEMWWPKLDDKINTILKSGAKNSPKKRDDRDLLEEILELSRLNVRKSREFPTPRFRMMVRDILQGLSETKTQLLEKHDIDYIAIEESFRFFEPPLEALSNILDLDSNFSEYQMIGRRIRRASIRKKERIEEDPF
jgi:hypothetical protein